MLFLKKINRLKNGCHNYYLILNPLWHQMQVVLNKAQVLSSPNKHNLHHRLAWDKKETRKQSYIDSTHKDKPNLVILIIELYEANILIKKDMIDCTFFLIRKSNISCRHVVFFLRLFFYYILKHKIYGTDNNQLPYKSFSMNIGSRLF